MAKEHGIKRGIKLPVSAPFHCSLMEPAAQRMEKALSETSPSAFTVPLYANVTAARVTDPAEEQRLLVEQVTGRVRWRESVLAMREDGVERFVELGGKVLGPMVGRIDKEAETVSLVTMDDLRTVREGERMMFSLEGKTALVTGASGGIGSAIAYALARQGARIALSGSNGDKLRAFREQLNADTGGDHVEITCNLSDTTQVEELIPATVDTLGSMNILVNNAGITRDNLAMRMKDEEWDDVIRVNLEASFRLMRASARPMMKAKGGRIISITSVVGHTGNPGQMNYVAAKAGLTGMSKSLAQELASRNITVNCVAPASSARR